MIEIIHYTELFFTVSECVILGESAIVAFSPFFIHSWAVIDSKDFRRNPNRGVAR